MTARSGCSPNSRHKKYVQLSAVPHALAAKIIRLLLQVVGLMLQRGGIWLAVCSGSSWQCIDY
jgi:hypothetical protein